MYTWYEKIVQSDSFACSYLVFSMLFIEEVQSVSSVAQSCLILCDPMECSMPGFPVLHRLPELAQIHVHQVSDAIQPSHPLSSPSPPASIFPSIRVFSKESALCIRWPKYWRFIFSISPSNEYQGLISFMMDWLDLLAVLAVHLETLVLPRFLLLGGIICIPKVTDISLL